MTARIGELDRADGSGRFAFGTSSTHPATLTVGDICALASFTGPIEVRLRDEQVSQSTFEVTHRPMDGVGGVSSRDLENVLSEVFLNVLNLSTVPRSLCQMVVQNLTPAPLPLASKNEGEGNSWPPMCYPDPEAATTSVSTSKAAAITAGTLAALHAGSMGMRAVPVGIAVSLLDNEFVVDPTIEEERRSTARFVCAWAFGTGISTASSASAAKEAEVVWAYSEGIFSKEQVRRCTCKANWSLRRHCRYHAPQRRRFTTISCASWRSTIAQGLLSIEDTAR